MRFKSKAKSFAHQCENWEPYFAIWPVTAYDEDGEKVTIWLETVLRCRSREVNGAWIYGLNDRSKIPDWLFPNW